jgi:hypothetical protein
MVFLPTLQCRVYRQSTANGSQAITQSFVKRSYIFSTNAKNMRIYAHGGGLSANASVRVGGQSSAIC